MAERPKTSKMQWTEWEFDADNIDAWAILEQEGNWCHWHIEYMVTCEVVPREQEQLVAQAMLEGARMVHQYFEESIMAIPELQGNGRIRVLLDDVVYSLLDIDADFEVEGPSCWDETGLRKQLMDQPPQVAAGGNDVVRMCIRLEVLPA